MNTQECINKSLLSFSSQEVPDWGYARNKRAVLMVPSAEWVQSVYSCQINIQQKFMIAPNRDSPYEGLLVYNSGENWKFIDFIGFSVQNQLGEYLPVFANADLPCVYLNPWKATYCYYVSINPSKFNEHLNIPFYINYYLNSKSPSELTTGYVEVSFPQGLKFGEVILTPSLHPFFDIRHMYHESRHYLYKTFLEHRDDHDRMVLSNYNRKMILFFENLKCDYYKNPELIDWHYKLGIVERSEVYSEQKNGYATLFRPECRTSASYFSLSLRNHGNQNTSFRINFACGLENKPAQISRSQYEHILKMSTEHDALQNKTVSTICGKITNQKVREAVLARIIGLLKFKINIADDNNLNFFLQTPYAGAWWFKTPWYRDVFEGYLSNYKTFLQFPDEKKEMKKTILFALKNQDQDSGRIPNRMNEFQDGSNLSYNCTDSVLLCLILANKLILTDNDLELAQHVIPHLITTVGKFSHNEFSISMATDAPPRLDSRTGLILSVPWHSWIDTRTSVYSIDNITFTGLPNRASTGFFEELFKHLGPTVNLGTFLSSPNFLLPEINAQWIIFLRGSLEVVNLLQKKNLLNRSDARFQQKIAKLLQTAIKHYRSVFWNPSIGYLYNIVYVSPDVKCTIVDTIECEAAVTAAAMLGTNVFDTNDLKQIWDHTCKKLLVSRTLTSLGNKRWPFGIITRNVDVGTYYGDGQYHSDVCWPRSTPYLIELLDLLNYQEIIAQILLNNLDHQSTEAAIFYNQELFSRPVGNNLSPDETTQDNPVPVKNPVQFWSQWCDPFLNHLESFEHIK
jgi:glycogen debranching enzyme